MICVHKSRSTQGGAVNEEELDFNDRVTKNYQLQNTIKRILQS